MTTTVTWRDTPFLRLPNGQPRIIALYSNISQAGKTTLARAAKEEYDYKWLSFAAPLKKWCDRIASDIAGERIHTSDYKTKWLPGFGKDVTGRRLMVGLGVSLRSVDPSIFTRMLRQRIAEINESDIDWPIIVDDMRFQNEWQLLKDLGACMIQIVHNEREPGIWASLWKMLLNRLGLNKTAEGHLMTNEPHFVLSAFQGQVQQLKEQLQCVIEGEYDHVTHYLGEPSLSLADIEVAV